MQPLYCIHLHSVYCQGLQTSSLERNINILHYFTLFYESTTGSSTRRSAKRCSQLLYIMTVQFCPAAIDKAHTSPASLCNSTPCWQVSFQRRRLVVAPAWANGGQAGRSAINCCYDRYYDDVYTSAYQLNRKLQHSMCPCSCLQTFMLSPSTSFSTDPMTRCPHEVTQHVRRRPPGLQRSVAHIESAGIAPATLAERLVALVSGLPDVSDKQQAATGVKWSTLSALLRLAWEERKEWDAYEIAYEILHRCGIRTLYSDREVSATITTSALSKGMICPLAASLESQGHANTLFDAP